MIWKVTGKIDILQTMKKNHQNERKNNYKLKNFYNSGWSQAENKTVSCVIYQCIALMYPNRHLPLLLRVQVRPQLLLFQGFLSLNQQLDNVNRAPLSVFRQLSTRQNQRKHQKLISSSLGWGCWLMQVPLRSTLSTMRQWRRESNEFPTFQVINIKQSRVLIRPIPGSGSWWITRKKGLTNVAIQKDVIRLT